MIDKSEILRFEQMIDITLLAGYEVINTNHIGLV